MATSSPPSQQQCHSSQVVLSLAHLLHQQTPNYDTTKNALLSESATCALQLATTANNDGGDGIGGEVHLFLTGSPRPTFAETNAWLLESHRNRSSPRRNQHISKNDDDQRDDNAADTDENDNNSSNNNTIIGLKRKESSDEPLVGHAVVNAISQTSGVGLKCIRSKMFQGTIDRPEWDQTRWTDGECLFSELVGLVGLESFEGGTGALGSGTATIKRGGKGTNLSANLITVPASSTSMSGGGGGMGEDTFEEIARNILRCLRRRRDSPPASVIHVLLPPNDLVGDDDHNGNTTSSMASSRLMEAFHKLEKYNDMIGVPRLMADAMVEVVHVSV